MKYLLSFSLLFVMSFAKAQTAEDAVKATVNQLFTAMLEADAAKLTDCFADSAVLQTIVKSKEGVVSVRNESVAAFAKTISSIPKNMADERIVFDVVKIDADLAIVWTPYRFYRNGTFSHCGANSFQLVKLNCRWKIQYLIDTRRKTGCAE
ncbi:MAG: nuclear transport factor 2 family protein [Sediminibacterium sp.]|jgi:ketosteroid isomerase-like protein|nr:nuclear transport factor 2 family protein [Chitinophagaceae bacterium]MCA6446719.1 nuclear transport factor 2 family protein [Chitinophagaceae bacterium]